MIKDQRKGKTITKPLSPSLCPSLALSLSLSVSPPCYTVQPLHQSKIFCFRCLGNAANISFCFSQAATAPPWQPLLSSYSLAATWRRQQTLAHTFPGINTSRCGPASLSMAGCASSFEAGVFLFLFAFGFVSSPFAAAAPPFRFPAACVSCVVSSASSPFPFCSPSFCFLAALSSFSFCFLAALSSFSYPSFLSTTTCHSKHRPGNSDWAPKMNRPVKPGQSLMAMSKIALCGWNCQAEPEHSLEALSPSWYIATRPER